MWEKFKGTLHELADSKKAVHSIFTVLTAALTYALGLVFMHYAAKWSLPDDIRSEIPTAAKWLAAGILGVGMSYQHGQGLADTGKEAAAIAADVPDTVDVTSDAFKTAVRTLGAEAVKAAVDQALVPPVVGIVTTLNPLVKVS